MRNKMAKMLKRVAKKLDPANAEKLYHRLKADYQAGLINPVKVKEAAK